MLRGRASENSLNARLKKKAKPQGFEQAASLEADPSMLEKTKMKKKKVILVQGHSVSGNLMEPPSACDQAQCCSKKDQAKALSRDPILATRGISAWRWIKADQPNG